MMKMINRKHRGTSDTYLVEQIQEILFKRYAVEKLIPFKKLLCIIVWAIISFILFQWFWIAISTSTELLTDQHCKILFELFIIAVLVFVWYEVWKIIGRFIPKFVLISLLGWFLIGANIIPNFIAYDDTPLTRDHASRQEGKVPPQQPLTRDHASLQDAQVTPKKNPDVKEKHSVLLPITRFFSVYEDEIDTKDKEFSWHYIDTFIAPVTMPLKVKEENGGKPSGDSAGKPGNETKKNQPPQNRAGGEILRFCRYASLLLIFVLFFDLFFTVAVYRQRDGRMSRFRLAFSVPASEREKNVKRKLRLFCIFLLLQAVLSMNYFILFLVLLFLAAVFIFRWEIEQRGQNHKPLSRAVLFVFIAHIFSLLSGEILLLTLFPIYTVFSSRYLVFHLYDSIVLGWTIIVGSLVTVLLGIITQVIWSGKRMTEGLKD